MMSPIFPAQNAAMTDTKPRYLENRTLDELRLGDRASLRHTLSLHDIQLFAVMSGDIHPELLEDDFEQSPVYGEIVNNGLWSATLISTLLGTRLPGPGSVLLGQSLDFTKGVMPGDTVTITVKVVEIDRPTKQVMFECSGVNQRDEVVLSGRAKVLAPTQKLRREQGATPEVHIQEPASVYREIVDQTRGLERVPMAVVHPCDRESLCGALDSRQVGLIEPLLIGPRSKIEAVARAEGFDLTGCTIIDVPHSHAAAEQGVALVRSGQAEALMKGSLHTDELMSAVVDGKLGLRTDRRISHVFVMSVPTYPRMLMITDAAINIEPTLEEKRDILQNAIDLAHVLGIAEPRVAILSAVETINTKLRSTIEAAALCKMADRKQITGAILDGPLAFDNAISADAALTKGIVSPVSGQADILLVPDLESGNMLAKQLDYLAGAEAAGIVLGAKVPIVLTSRADKASARMASCAIAVLIAHAKRAKVKVPA